MKNLLRRMKILSILCALLSITVSVKSSNGQSTQADHITFKGLEVFGKIIMPAVFLVQYPEPKNNVWIPCGTGFFIEGNYGEVNGVTCSHVINPLLENNHTIYIGFEDSVKGYLRLKCEILYNDKKQDVAIMRPLKDKNMEIINKSRWFQRDVLGDTSLLIPGKGVLIPGYPLGIGVYENQNFPVLRFGMIAQYSKGNTFLIDGIASHGNSGSPVFSTKDGKVIGMVTSHVTDRINLFDENGRPVASLPYNAGLAQAVKISVITKILGELKE